MQLYFVEVTVTLLSLIVNGKIETTMSAKSNCNDCRREVGDYCNKMQQTKEIDNNEYLHTKINDSDYLQAVKNDYFNVIDGAIDNIRANNDTRGLNAEGNVIDNIQVITGNSDNFQIANDDFNSDCIVIYNFDGNQSSYSIKNNEFNYLQVFDDDCDTGNFRISNAKVDQSSFGKRDNDNSCSQEIDCHYDKLQWTGNGNDQNSYDSSRNIDGALTTVICINNGNMH